MGLFGLESSQPSIRFGCTHYRRKRRWLTRPGQFEAQADPNLSAAARTHGDARSTQRRMSSRNTRPARPVRGCPWNSRRCTPTVLAAGRRPLYVRTPRHAGPQRNKVTHAGTEKKRPASPKLLGCGAPTTALTWAFASSKVVSSGYGLTSANFHHGSRAWSRIFCAEKPCPLRRSRRSGRRYLHIVTVTSG